MKLHLSFIHSFPRRRDARRFAAAREPSSRYYIRDRSGTWLHSKSALLASPARTGAFDTYADLIDGSEVLSRFSCAEWAVAAKPVDRDNSTLVKLGTHATKLVEKFIILDPADRDRTTELLAELRQVISEFRRLCPPSTFRKLAPLHAVQWCSICHCEITQDRESFETIGAIYHLDCYERETDRS